MELNDFSDLSNFIYGEYDKLSETFGLSSLPKKSIKFVEKSIRTYSKLYKKPLLEREKRELEIRTAIETMPHNWVWKLFHSKLWSRVKQRLKELEEMEYLAEKTTDKPAEQKPDILVPAVIVPRDVANIEPIVVRNEDFDNDFE